MNSKIKSIIAYSISILLIIFWLYVGLEKAWSWKNFELSLHQQPLPEWSIGIIYWLVPLVEIATGVLLAFRRNKLKQLGYWGSILLLTAFTIFIGLGVIGVYEQRPCTCSSIFNELSWNWHLVVNVALLIISILGLYLNRVSNDLDHPTQQRKTKNTPALFKLLLNFSRAQYNRLRKMFPKKFALFPGRPV
ncbi:MauE/DoxX family redox-associated membrane protein [Sphingobacterium faecium]|jgi:uncharacterized membrane protein YkvI|uniref:MauE/DoxX family redox-associated membrane protein n=1 Tax=Sphingobacterium faecium TaxID=34087 RepID=UPI003209C073